MTARPAGTTVRKQKAKGQALGVRSRALARSGTITSVQLPLALPVAGSRPFDTVGFGLNSIDLVAVVREYPTPNSKQRMERFAKLPGGQTASAMAACARLGWKARYVGTFGGDDLGALGQGSLRAAGVDISCCRIVEEATNQFAVILVDASSGSRTVLWDRHPALATEPSTVPLNAVTSGRVLLVDCHETRAATVAARTARAAGIPTVIDVERVRPGIDELLRQIDVIIAAEGFPAALTAEQAPAPPCGRWLMHFDRRSSA